MGINHLNKKFSDNDTSLILSKINQGEFAMLCKLVEIRDSSCGQYLSNLDFDLDLCLDFSLGLKKTILNQDNFHFQYSF